MRGLPDTHVAVLRKVNETRSGIATHWMNEAAGCPGSTAKTRRVLISLRRLGLIEGVMAPGGNVFWWKSTEACRALLDPASSADGGILLASFKRTHRGHAYISLWRANRAGYAWRLPWAGAYSFTEAAAIADDDASLYPEEHTYAVPLAVIRALASTPAAGDVDGDRGPVLTNTKAHWDVIIAANRIIRAETAA
jgi:hypothetical protein